MTAASLVVAWAQTRPTLHSAPGQPGGKEETQPKHAPAAAALSLQVVGNHPAQQAQRSVLGELSILSAQQQAAQPAALAAPTAAPLNAGPSGKGWSCELAKLMPARKHLATAIQVQMRFAIPCRKPRPWLALIVSWEGCRSRTGEAQHACWHAHQLPESTCTASLAAAAQLRSGAPAHTASGCLSVLAGLPTRSCSCFLDRQHKQDLQLLQAGDVQLVATLATTARPPALALFQPGQCLAFTGALTVLCGCSMAGLDCAH